MITLYIFQIQAEDTMTAKALFDDPQSLYNRISAVGKLDNHNNTEKKILLTSFRAGVEKSKSQG